MNAVDIGGVGVCAAGLSGWTHARAVLAGDLRFEAAQTASRVIDSLPPTERRRVNETSRLALLAAFDAVAALSAEQVARLPTVFVSSDGDGVVLGLMLGALAQTPIAASPTVFHNSVFNAPAGYWSLASGSTAASTSLCADGASFAAALLEGYAQVRATSASVLVVAVDAPFPSPIEDLGRSVNAFACALLLGPCTAIARTRLGGWTIGPPESQGSGDDALATAYAGNSAACALPLLRALASPRGQQVALPYLDDCALRVEVT